MKSALDSYEWNYNFKDGYFFFDVLLDGRIKNTSFIITVSKYGYEVSAVLEDISVGETVLTDVLEYINMVNNHEAHASMSVYEDFIMCSIYLNYRGMLPNENLIKIAILDICKCIENFGGGILDILEKNGTPNEIFERNLEGITDEK